MVSAAVPSNFAPSFRRLVAAPVLRSYAVISKPAPREGNANEWCDRNYLDAHFHVGTAPPRECKSMEAAHIAAVGRCPLSSRRCLRRSKCLECLGSHQSGRRNEAVGARHSVPSGHYLDSVPAPAKRKEHEAPEQKR